MSAGEVEDQERLLRESPLELLTRDEEKAESGVFGDALSADTVVVGLTVAAGVCGVDSTAGLPTILVTFTSTLLDSVNRKK